jgi:general L-amino acid transport system permease protein
MQNTINTTPNMGLGAKIIIGLRDRFFSSIGNSILTILSVWLLLMAIPALFDWGFTRASFYAKNAQECREAGGACWAFIGEKYRFILFGTYPFEQQWRPLVAMLLFVAMLILSTWRRLWNISLLVLWIVGLGTAAILMWGGIFGLTYVENSNWGGLPITLLLATFAIALSFPVGVVLALGRRSKMPAIKSICVVYIELIRGVPLISLLFMASLMLPLFLPEGLTIDKLLRALIAMVLFAAAYVAETVRGGLQAIPKGQFEGAESLGLGYWQQMRLIILPQALKIVIPPLVGIFISMFKDTSLVVIIGIFDLTLAAKSALADSSWQGFGVEAYVFISMIYFIFCFLMSRYSQVLERRLSVGQKR